MIACTHIAEADGRRQDALDCKAIAVDAEIRRQEQSEKKAR